jgi:ABC-type sugar transport system substrate-binding protein
MRLLIWLAISAFIALGAFNSLPALPAVAPTAPAVPTAPVVPSDPDELWRYLNEAPAEQAASDAEIEAFISDYSQRRQQALDTVRPYSAEAERILERLQGLEDTEAMIRALLGE